MSMAAATATDTVQLKHHYAVPRDQVFTAWTSIDALNLWLGPHSHTSTVEKFELKDGGKYQIRMTPVSEDHDCKGNPDDDSVCAGTFVEIKSPERLVMTFNWISNGADMGETLLTIEMFEADGGTDVVLTHERLPDEELRQAHEGGWQGSLECLEEYLQEN